MERIFIHTVIFDKRWEELNLTDNDLWGLQEYILQNPGIGDIIVGTGGAIKLRWALPNTGKRGGIRIIYIDLINFEKIYLLTCYPKSKKDNLTDKEKSAIKETLKRITKAEEEIFNG